MRVARSHNVTWLLLATVLGACHNWEPIPIAPSIAAEHEVRVTRSGGDRVMLRNPTLDANSLAGDTTRVICGESFGCAEADTRIRLPLADVSTVEAARFNDALAKQVGLGVLIGIGVVALTILESDCFPLC